MRLFHQTRCESKKIQVGAVFPHQMCNFTHRVYNLGSVVVIYAVVCECKRNNRPKNFVNRNIWKMLHSACPQSSNRIVQGPTGKLPLNKSLTTIINFSTVVSLSGGKTKTVKVFVGFLFIR